MKSQIFAASLLLVSLLSAAPAPRKASSLRVSSALKIPGATLQPGSYAVSIEDRLTDRAIVRIASSTGSDHYLLLAVPSARVAPTSGVFSYFRADNNAQALRGWKCADCSTPLEFVYLKGDAVALTGTSAKPVLAIDPTYDKLPSNLSADDMKVVTLWLVSPETITADNRGQGVKAAKLVDSQPLEVASAKMPRHLPHTATNTYALLAAGLVLLLGAGGLRLRRA